MSGSLRSKLTILAALLAGSALFGCRTRTMSAPPNTTASGAASSELPQQQEMHALQACADATLAGFRKVADARDLRFQGKLSPANALCRGGQRAMQFRNTPWVDWSNYWGSGDETSLPDLHLTSKLVASRGVAGALLDLEYQRVELTKFNLFDNSETFQQFISGRDGVSGPALKVWPEMRLPASHPRFHDVGGNGRQECKGELIRWRTIDGICNDILNPVMGSRGQPFARNVEFESTFPESSQNLYTRNRHGDRLGLMQPRPAGDQPQAAHAQSIPSRKLQ